MSLRRYEKGVSQARSDSARRSSRVALYALAAMIGLFTDGSLHSAWAQQAPDVPALRHRSAQNPNEAAAPTVATGHTYLSEDAEGEYPWKSERGDGEIELYFDGGKLQGYMTEPLDPHSQRASPLVFDFARTHIDGNALSFTTRQLHGGWYSFSGHLERGLVGSPSQAAFYLLTGTLTEHGGGGDVGRIVSLPREPGSD
jgi:hypothetical protein